MDYYAVSSCTWKSMPQWQQSLNIILHLQPNLFNMQIWCFYFFFLVCKLNMSVALATFMTVWEKPNSQVLNNKIWPTEEKFTGKTNCNVLLVEWRPCRAYMYSTAQRGINSFTDGQGDNQNVKSSYDQLKFWTLWQKQQAIQHTNYYVLHLPLIWGIFMTSPLIMSYT